MFYEVYDKKEYPILMDELFSLRERILKEDLADAIVNKLNNPFIKGYLQLTKKPLPSSSLKKNLGLEKFKNVYIQRILNIPFPIFIITVDSRYPQKTIPTSKVKKLLSTQFHRVTSTKDSIISMEPKFSVLKPLGQSDKTTFPAGSLIIVRDIGGEEFVKKNMWK